MSFGVLNNFFMGNFGEMRGFVPPRNNICIGGCPVKIWFSLKKNLHIFLTITQKLYCYIIYCYVVKTTKNVNVILTIYAVIPILMQATYFYGFEFLCLIRAGLFCEFSGDISMFGIGVKEIIENFTFQKYSFKFKLTKCFIVSKKKCVYELFCEKKTI